MSDKEVRDENHSGDEDKTSSTGSTERPSPAPERHIKVIGPNTANGQLSMWHYRSVEAASQFAEFLATETHAKVMVCEMIGVWQIKNAPVEFIAAGEKKEPPKPEAEIPGAFVSGQGRNW